MCLMSGMKPAAVGTRALVPKPAKNLHMTGIPMHAPANWRSRRMVDRWRLWPMAGADGAEGAGPGLGEVDSTRGGGGRLREGGQAA